MCVGEFASCNVVLKTNCIPLNTVFGAERIPSGIRLHVTIPAIAVLEAGGCGYGAGMMPAQKVYKLLKLTPKRGYCGYGAEIHVGTRAKHFSSLYPARMVCLKRTISESS